MAQVTIYLERDTGEDVKAAAAARSLRKHLDFQRLA